MTDATPDPIDLDVVIIACDNASTIRRTLDSVRDVARRVIVVDSGSRDRTVDLCREAGAEVIHHDWAGHIDQKQFALEQATAAWVLSLDSDESLDQELREEVRAVVAKDDPEIIGYEVNRRTWFGGHEMKWTWQPEWRTRLVRRGRAKWSGYNPHDRLDADGKTERLAGLLRHDSFDNARHFLNKQIGHGFVAAESYYALGQRGSALRLIASPIAATIKQLILRSSWRDGWRGWIAAFGTGVGVTAKHIRLLELTYSSSKNDRAPDDSDA